MLPAIIWFGVGLTLGLVIVGFVALGSYERGRESARRERFSTELTSRRVVAISRRAVGTEERATA